MGQRYVFLYCYYILISKTPTSRFRVRQTFTVDLWLNTRYPCVFDCSVATVHCMCILQLVSFSRSPNEIQLVLEKVHTIE